MNSNNTWTTWKILLEHKSSETVRFLYETKSETNIKKMKKISKTLPNFHVMYISQLKKQLFTGVYGTANLKNLRKFREKAASGNRY